MGTTRTGRSNHPDKLDIPDRRFVFLDRPQQIDQMRDRKSDTGATCVGFLSAAAIQIDL